ncbi:MAG: tetratricopeptide repeat protein, partial [Methanomicrobiales archaeon]|nr:tetratricopeptide repeat protein [Methanomicrobiales archaeon]
MKNNTIFIKMSPASGAGKITLHTFVWFPIFLVLITCPVFGYETVTDLSTPQNLTTAAGQLYNAGEYRAALDKLDAALLITPDMVDAWYLKGLINLRLEKYPSAVVAFDRAIQLNPKNPEYWCGRGDAFFAQKQYRNALPSYESA